MADKFRQTFPIAVSFSDGELPTASKLTGLSTQSRNGQGIIQYALGDLWNQGGDNLLTSGPAVSTPYVAPAPSRTALAIPNLARYIGPGRLANPRIPSLPNIQSYTHAFSNDNGKYEVALAFPPINASASFTWSAGLGPACPSVKKTSRALLAASTDYYVDPTTGVLYTYRSIDNRWSVAYTPLIVGDIDTTASYNVIPDPSTDWTTYPAFYSVMIQYKNLSDASQGYYIYLPPRIPLMAARKPNRYPQQTVANMTTSPSSTRTFWQDVSGTTAADTSSNAAHFRYNLPSVITGATGWASGAQLPAGLIYLWDDTNTGTILEGITFYAESAATPGTYKLFVPANTPLDTYLSTSYGAAAYPSTRLKLNTHAAALYPLGGLKLITVGTDLSLELSGLMQQYLNHNHASASSLPSMQVPHSGLNGLFSTAGTPPFISCSGVMDDHPQYLERHGAQNPRDSYNNGMLGDLLMNSSNSGSNYINILSNSNVIRFNTRDPVVLGGSAIYGWGLVDGGQQSTELVLDSYAPLKAYGSIDIFDPTRTVNTQAQFRWTNSTKNVNLQKYGTGTFTIGADNTLALTGTTITMNQNPRRSTSVNFVVTSPLILLGSYTSASPTHTSAASDGGVPYYGATYTQTAGAIQTYALTPVWPHSCTITAILFCVGWIDINTSWQIWARRTTFGSPDTLANETMYKSGGTYYVDGIHGGSPWVAFSDITFSPVNNNNGVSRQTNDILISVWFDKTVTLQSTCRIEGTYYELTAFPT